MNEENPLGTRLVAFLQQLSASTQSRDKGNLAILRRSLSKPPGEDPATFTILGRFMRDDSLDHRERMMFLVAGLYATHPHHSGNVGNLGATLARLKSNPSAELRFKRLMQLDRDELAVPMRRIVMLAKAKGAAINYVRLYTDLSKWHASGSVQRAWARLFWSVPKSDSADADSNV